jgi:hypothetical protein
MARCDVAKSSRSPCFDRGGERRERWRHAPAGGQQARRRLAICAMKEAFCQSLTAPGGYLQAYGAEYALGSGRSLVVRKCLPCSHIRAQYDPIAALMSREQFLAITGEQDETKWRLTRVLVIVDAFDLRSRQRQRVFPNATVRYAPKRGQFTFRLARFPNYESSKESRS